MRRYKYRVIRLFHIMVWSLIIIFSLNLLIKCIRIFGTDSSGVTPESNLVTTAGNYMVQSIPIMDYISASDNNANNMLFNNLVGTFPINRYVTEVYDDTDNNYIEDDSTDAIFFANESNLLFNNDLYAELILQGIKTYNEQATNQSTEVINEYDEDTSDKLGNISLSGNGLMPIDIINGEVYMKNDSKSTETLGSQNGEYFTLKQLSNRNFLLNNFYIIDSATRIVDDLFDAKKLVKEDMKLKVSSDKPQILIYHTHSQEAYSDSRKGKEADTIVGVGTYLTNLLTEKYGFNVIHDKSKYDMMEGYLERNLAYNHAADGLKEILNKNPSIEVVIDLHRDGTDYKRVTRINGEDVAQVMLFNGLSRNTKGKITYLDNPYLQDNLAFSLQTQLKGRELYPGLMYKNYLHAYRYNMQYRKKSLLVELGTDKNTVKEAMNAMDYFAEVLYQLLSGESN
ncbi:MAG: putative rane protein [Anaerocolumna sp.]|nr:putative rane protein [Anaerocolumna sp.]